MAPATLDTYFHAQINCACYRIVHWKYPGWGPRGLQTYLLSHAQMHNPCNANKTVFSSKPFKPCPAFRIGKQPSKKHIHMSGQARTQWSTHGARAAARTVPQAAYRCCQRLSSSGDSWANPHACGSCGNSIASKMHLNCQIVDLRTKAKWTRASSGRAKRAGRIRNWTSHYRNDCRGNLVSL